MRNEDTPIVVERVVNDIDEIVRYVRFPGWQNTSAGEREVRKALRKTLFKYQAASGYGAVRQGVWIHSRVLLGTSLSRLRPLDLRKPNNPTVK